MNPEEGLDKILEEQDKELMEEYQKQNDPGPQPDPLDTRNLKFNLVDQIDNEQPEPDLDRYRMTPDRLTAATLYEIGQAMAVNKATANAKWAGKFGIIAYPVINFISGAQSNYTAQQIRTVEELGWFDRNWGEVLSSGLVDVIPGLDVLHKTKRGAKLAAQLSKSPARRITAGGIEAGTRTALQHQGEVALNEQRFLTNEELATSFGVGSVFGGTIRGGVEGVSALRSRYAAKNPDKLTSKLIKDSLYANIDNPEELARRQGDDYWKDYFVLDGKDQAKVDKVLADYTRKNEAKKIQKAIVDDAKRKGIPVKRHSSPGVPGYERTYGWVYLEDLEAIARKNNLSAVDVAAYIEGERIRNVSLDAAKRYLNIEATPGYVAKVKRYLEEDLESGKITRQFAKTILNDLDRRLGKETKKRGVNESLEDFTKRQERNFEKKISVYSIGHKKAIGNYFAESITGGDVSSNKYLQEFFNQYITDPDGTVRKIKQNAGLKDAEDMNLYAAVKLQGTSYDLEDDFLRYVAPNKRIQRLGAFSIPHGGDLTEIIDMEYAEVAEFLWREVTPIFRKALKDQELPPAPNDISNIITDAITATVDKFEELAKTRIYRAKDGSPINEHHLYEFFVLRKKDVFEKTVSKQLTNTWTDSIVKGAEEYDLNINFDK